MQYIGVCAIFVLCAYVQFTICRSKECENGECCVGYKRDAKTERCVECDIGHYGPNCSMKCPFPYFGSRCNSTCLCSNESCHFANGCADVKKSTVIANESQERDVKHRPTPAINPTTKKKVTKQTDVGPQIHWQLGSVLRTTTFLVMGLFSVVLIFYLLTYSKLLWAKSFPQKHICMLWRF